MLGPRSGLAGGAGEVPAVTRPEHGAPLDPVGRASRASCTLSSGGVAELWSLPETDQALARRLARLGAEGVGGFDLGWGQDALGAFAVRRVPALTVERLGRGERLDPLEALARVRDVARALAACERAALFPGPLRPGEIALGEGSRLEAWITAEGYVRSLVGEPARQGGSSGPSPRWTPPEQASGAPWDNAANRYVLGLVAYRLVAGHHPWSGSGLRDALAAQSAPPPPFDDAVARTLRPGFQSLVLALIDPLPARRPASAEAIAQRCDELLSGIAPPRGRAISTPPAPRPASRPARAVRTAGGPPLRRVLLTMAPLVLGLIAALAGVASSHATAPLPAAPPHIADRRPLTSTLSSTCAGCHAREVAEWQRSVMAHAAKSPLFGALESVVEEQVGRDARCPNGAGVLRKPGGEVCRDERTGRTLTGTGGEHWCVNCHAAANTLADAVPPWSARSLSSAGTSSRQPLRDILPAGPMEGISCAVCHQAIGPVHVAGGARTGDYEGNPTWTSPVTGAVFRMRPEDGAGIPGIGNSGYQLDPGSLLVRTLGASVPGDPVVHRRPPAAAKSYLASSEHCGACHDVRLFGTDAVGVRDRGEHFKRLRNAYSEWRAWADTEKAAGRKAASCQDCHMSLYPGVCVPGAGSGKDGCPAGTRFEGRAPGERARGLTAATSASAGSVASHYFTSVDLPLAPDFPDRWADDRTLDASGQPLGLEARRLQLLRHTFSLAIGNAARAGSQLEIPVQLENVGAGHRVPAGFSQERETWLELVVEDARGGVVYEVGRIAADDADLQDKAFVRVTTGDGAQDSEGRPLGVFGADVVDGPDVPRWTPNPILGGTRFRGQGLLNFQNGFLRCVRCIGVIDGEGRCQPGPNQGRTRADRFDEGAYDLDTGECRSNLTGPNAFFETYFPVGGLDADRGIAKAPDAILDTRSAPPGVPITYVYAIDTRGRPGPFTVRARLRFRPFPPFLLRAFIDYEARKAAQGLRPSGPQITASMLRRNHPVDLAEATGRVD
ncbi:MAG: Serine/threonine-protein kinase PknA [Labilithrix sp.]|nr:Serine/threonine-protein kinase PknA [Labilithrix sp.]